MLSNPNMSLSEFASRFGITVTPLQREIIRRINQCTAEGRPPCIIWREPRYRPSDSGR